MSTIRRWFLTDSVDIVTVTRSEGRRSTSTTSDVPAWVTYEDVRDMSAEGDVFRTRTIVFLKPDVSVSVGDEIVVDGETRPVISVRELKDHYQSHHLEVELG